MCNCGARAARDEYQVTVPSNHSNVPEPGIAYRVLRADGTFEDKPTEALAYAALAALEGQGGSVFPVQKDPVDA